MKIDVEATAGAVVGTEFTLGTGDDAEDHVIAKLGSIYTVKSILKDWPLNTPVWVKIEGKNKIVIKPVKAPDTFNMDTAGNFDEVDALSDVGSASDAEPYKITSFGRKPPVLPNFWPMVRDDINGWCLCSWAFLTHFTHNPAYL